MRTATAPVVVDSDLATPAMTDLAKLIHAELNHVVALRHDLHRHPELSFLETRTSQVVQRELKALGIEFKAGLGGGAGYAGGGGPSLGPGTGVVAHLPATTPANNQGRHTHSIGLRADMDALPIVEQTGVPYASVNPGVMHACGHDGHTAILLGAARVLSKIPRPHPVTLVFQPAEEGGGGAEKMCKQGALAGQGKGGLGPPVSTMFGLHGWPQIPLGTVATKPGPLLAAVDDFDVTIKGVQAHGAYPHFGRDPILAAAHVITAIQSIASRNVGPLDSVVVTVGAIHAGTANNIIPEEVKFIGTVRTLKPETRALAKGRFIEVVNHAANAFGCEARIDYHEGYPVTSNDPDATNQFLAIARNVLGEPKVQTLEHPTMGGEDFAYYGHHAKACFFFLGLKPPGVHECPTLHQPDFDFNDQAIPLGIELFVRLATAK